MDVHSALHDRFGRVLGQNCKICTTDPKKLAIMVILSCMARMSYESLSRDNRVDDELRKGMNVKPRYSLSRTRMLSMNLM
jgi:hypothetical protein